MNDSNLNKNNILNAISTLTNTIFPLIIFQYVTRVLGINNIGKYNFSSAIVSYFNLIATLGISSYAIRECAKLSDNREDMNEFASNIFSIDMYSTIIAYIMLATILFLSIKLKEYQIYILLLSSSFLINTIGCVWIYNSVNDFKFLSIRTILINILSLAGTLLFVKNQHHLYRYIIINVVLNLVSNLYSVINRKKYIDIKFKFLPDFKKHVKKIFLLFSQTVSMLIYTNADIIMLGYYYNDSTVGAYSIAVKIYIIINNIISSVINVAIPGLSYDFEHRNYKEFNKKITYVVDYILLLFLPAFVGLNFMTNEIIRLVSGKFIFECEIVLHILTISLMFSLISAVLGLAILFPTGYDRINFNSCIISALTNIILNVYFIPKYGIVGAAITTSIAELVGFLNKIKYIDINIKVSNFFNTFLKYLFGSILISVICILSKKFISVSNYRVIVAILLSAFVYFGYLIIIKDKFFINLIKPVIKRL